MADKSTRPPGNRRAPVMLSFCALVTAFFILAEADPRQWNAPLKDSETYLQDFFARTGRFTPANTNLVLIGIDRPSYDDVIFPEEATNDPVLAALRGRFPWSRKVWAALIQRLGDAGAKTIVIDLVFAANSDGDDELSEALAKYSNRIVIGSNITFENTDRGTQIQLITPNSALIPDTDQSPAFLDPRVGYVNVWPDDDGVIRSARFFASNLELGDAIDAPAGAIASSLDTLAVKKFGEENTLPTGTQPQRIRFTSPPGGFEIIPVGDVLTPKIWEQNYDDGKFFRGKLVLIGPTANLFQDYHLTPFRTEMAGPEVHLNIINAALHGEFLYELPFSMLVYFILLAGLVAALLCQSIRQPIKRLLVTLALSAVIFLTAKMLYDHANIVYPIISPLLVLNIIGIGALGYDFVVERVERVKLRHTMGLYFSPRVLEAVLANPGSMKPRRAEVVLLLTDLRNSTPLAEALGPQGMFELLNTVFEAQTNAIMSEEGNLEHFLGDQFLSYWGAPQPQPDAAAQAARAAIKLITAMEQLRATLSPEIQKLFGYGVALHSGSVMVGNKGSAQRLDYGLVGDTVNEAARIEALTKYYGVKLLLTGEIAAQFKSQSAWRLVDRIIVKGKNEPVEIFECENPCTPPKFAELCARYQAAYDEYTAGQFAAAQGQFEELAMLFFDGPALVLASRCGELAANPPATWNGIWKMESK